MEGDTWSDYRPSFDKANNDNVRAVKTGSLVVIQFHEWSRKGYGLFRGGVHCDPGILHRLLFLSGRSPECFNADACILCCRTAGVLCNG